MIETESFLQELENAVSRDRLNAAFERCGMRPIF